MRRSILSAVAALLLFTGLASGQAVAAPNDVFWAELQKLCGKAFAGTVAAAPADDTTFKDKALVMHIRSCEKNRIRIPFMVGDDRSRTWVLTRKGGRVELRHDHRHQDGKPDAVTMYGGWTTSVGMPTRQMFPADDKTVKVIAAAATNVWWIDLIPGEQYSYNLRRMGSERYFSIKFDTKKPVSARRRHLGVGRTSLFGRMTGYDQTKAELDRIGADWAEAMVANDAELIGSFMADDWVIVSDRGISTKEQFLGFVRSGALTHSSFEMRGEARVKRYGDTAVLTCRVVNTAHFGGEQFDADEWTTDLFVKHGDRWLCALSHITPVNTENDLGEK